MDDKSSDKMTIPELLEAVKRLKPLLVAGNLGVCHLMAGIYFLLLKERCEYGTFDKRAAKMGYSDGHRQKLMQIAKGVAAQGIPLKTIGEMTFDQLYSIAVNRKTLE